MKAKVYFCTESDSIDIILRKQKIGRQAIDTIYELVWECEFKNILNVGRIWLKFKEEERPFGIPTRQKRSHRKISPGDIIQIANNFYVIGQVGARQIELIDQSFHRVAKSKKRELKDRRNLLLAQDCNTYQLQCLILNAVREILSYKRDNSHI